MTLKWRYLSFVTKVNLDNGNETKSDKTHLSKGHIQI